MAVNRKHALAELIDEVKLDQSVSDEDIARHARRAGHKISKQHIANLRVTDPLKSLVPQTLRALAAGLEQPLPRIVEAALKAAGLPAGPPSDWSIEAAINADPELPLPAKRMLLVQVAAARDGGAALTTIRSLAAPSAAGRAARRRPHASETR